MKQLMRNVRLVLTFLLVLAIVFGAGLFYQMHQSQTVLLAVAGENKESLRQQYAQAGTIYSQEGVKLAYSDADAENRYYVEDPNIQMAVSHYVGDYTHHMSNTVETLYQNELLGKNRGMIEQLILDVSGKGLEGDNVHLTIDAALSGYARQLLGDYRGSVVLMNYETGDVLGMASTPATYMENIINYENLPDSSLFNRSLNGAYEPGSTWKIMTAAAWINSNAYDPELVIESDGSPLVPNGASDHESKNMYGNYDLNRAFTRSSNVFFGQLSVLMGQKDFNNYLNNSGLSSIKSINRLSVSPAVMDSSAAANDQGLLSWFGTGQPVGELKLNFSPLELASIGSAVANGGKLLQPNMIKCIENPIGQKKEAANTKVNSQLFSPEVANNLKSLMINAIQSEETIQYAAGIPGFTVGGKSGTVQRQGADGGSTNSLWIGFVDNADYPYAVAAVVEGSNDTNATAIYIGNSLLAQAINLRNAGH